jgi:uncharacterized protein (DUF1800 family)
MQGTIAAIVCASILFPLDGVAAPSDHPPTPRHESSQLQGDQRILHALNRFTFGPRPDDLEAVRAMGLERWFDRQLHPGAIDNPDLDARLAAYPAMHGSTEELLRRMPSNALIRQAIDGKVAVPSQGALHAIYEDAMYRMTEKKQHKQNKEQPDIVDPAAQSMAPTAEVLAPDSESTAAILALPPQQRLARLIAMEPVEADLFFKSLRGPQRAALVADLSPEMKETIGVLENPQRTIAEELIAVRLTRDIYSNAQLQEVMTDFWLNHFNVYLRKNEAMPYYLVSYERDVIAPHALGKFEDLLEQVAHSPAMLLYLDNAESIGPDSIAAQRARMNIARNPDNQKKTEKGLNENYARELMELHTLGVNGGYTQSDVIQVARILTGWGVDRPQRGGGFVFNPNRHEPGTKKVLGKKFKENGEREGRDLLHFLATRPATARFISRKLAVRFVSDDPPESLVDRMSKSYLSSGGDIATVLKTMFHSPEFWSAEVYRAKVKTPLEYVVSAVRASNADIANLRPLANALRGMGMPLYGAIPPTGYKWEASDWISTEALLNRMNFALAFAANRMPGITTNWAPNHSIPKAPDPQSQESRLESTLLAGGVSNSTRSAVLEQFATQNPNAQPAQNPHALPMALGANHPTVPILIERQDQLLAGLLLGSPEFQRR